MVKSSNKNEIFMRKAKIIHGDKYDYSFVEYVNAKTKIKILCPIHGMFEQVPNYHLSKCGCSSCGIEKTIEKNKDSESDFIGKAAGSGVTLNELERLPQCSELNSEV